ncbi:MAG: hypothetical protein JXL67_09135 [Calditrichaeota bacterium]|nr:hypothetical protein [Calditrichota bacterium]
MAANRMPENESVYQNFRIKYGQGAEKITRNIISILEIAVPEYEKFYGTDLEREVVIFLPSSLLDFHPLVFDQLPEWSNGVFVPDRNQIILKKPQWYSTDQNFTQVLRHELSHVYFHRMFANSEVPLWFNEGLAEYLSGTALDISNGLKISNAMFAGQLILLSHVDSLQDFSWNRAQLAYLQSLSAVIFLEKRLNQLGISWQDFFESVRRNGFEQALKNSLGMDPIDFEIKWYHWLKENYKWFIIFNWENLIWVVMIIILAGALYAMRYRNRKTLRRWEEEEEKSKEEQLTQSIEI